MKKSIQIFTLIFLGFSFLVSGQMNYEISTFETYIQSRYKELTPLEETKPPFDLYRRGMIGYYDLLANDKKIANQKITLIDFRISSNKKRFWVIDIKSNKVIHYRLVAHGKNTGEEYAKTFSNKKNSNQSSLGFYITAETYLGKHGLSLRLDGQEKGFNDQVRNRAVVMHSANYVSKDFARKYGRLGRSYGCPAIAVKDHKVVIQGLAKGSLLFIYYPEANYEAKTLLNNVELASKYYIQNSDL
ncbi:MAG: murein L,D-transpeptidase catalytic domain family protein [Cyclobacteriaceae bacterium]